MYHNLSAPITSFVLEVDWGYRGRLRIVNIWFFSSPYFLVVLVLVSWYQSGLIIVYTRAGEIKKISYIS